MAKKIINGMLYTSGQIAINPTTGELVTTDIETETELVMQNLKAVLEAADMTFDNVIKTTIFIMNMGDFAKIRLITKEEYEAK